jgi:hypothetical protein
MLSLPNVDECAASYKRIFTNPFDSLDQPFSYIDPWFIPEVQAALPEVLPGSVMQLISRYDFSHLSVGHIMFEYGTNYSELVDMNRAGYSAWWAGMLRPQHQLMVARTTSWGIIVDCKTEAIAAFRGPLRDEVPRRICGNFDIFVRMAVMTTIEGEKMSDLYSNPEILGGEDSDFWMDLANATA